MQMNPWKRRPVTDDLRAMCVVKRWENHTASGGYDLLAQAVGAEVVRRRTDKRIPRRVVGRFWRQFSHPKPYLLDYRYEDWLAEAYVLSRSWWHPPDIVHVLYGDEELDLLLRQRRFLSCPLIATFHLPPTRVQERFEEIQRHLVSGIDAAIVVARSQLQPFRNWIGADRVIYLPHGINTDRFCPAELRPHRECVRLLMVGHHMRDWKTLGEIIGECQARGLAVQFDIVDSAHGLSGSAYLPNVHLHGGILEEDLIRLYREADALLLPVRDATATNAALEALACGTPVISTMVGGMPDYVDDTCGWLFENGDVAGIVELICGMSKEPGIAASRRHAARSKALGFDWKRVAAKLRLIYSAVAQHRSLGVAELEWK